MPVTNPCQGEQKRATAAPSPHTHHALLTCFEAGIAGKRPQAGSEVWAPRPTRRSRGAASTRPGPAAHEGRRTHPSPAVTGGLGPCPSCRYLLPGAASPTHHPGLRGRRRLVPRLSHEAPREPRFALPPPRPAALRPHPRLWSRGERQPGSTFAALAAPGEASFLSPALPASSFRDPLSPRKTPSTSRGHRVGPNRLGPDSDSKMASVTRGRALSPARLRPRERARVRWGAPAEGGGRRQWAAPAGSALPRCRWGPPPPGSRSLLSSSRRRYCYFEGILRFEASVGGLELARWLKSYLRLKLESLGRWSRKGERRECLRSWGQLHSSISAKR